MTIFDLPTEHFDQSMRANLGAALLCSGGSLPFRFTIRLVVDWHFRDRRVPPNNGLSIVLKEQHLNVTEPVMA